MVTSRERARNFKRALLEFLEKWNAEIVLETEIKGYEVSDTKIMAYIDLVCDGDEVLAEWAEVDFGSNIIP